MLEHYRVLDLADNESAIAGMVLAELGAEVIAVEPPEGNALRLRGPFAGDRPGPETSLPWAAWGRSKRSVIADLETEAGRERLRQLAATADVLIESAPPGAMAARGLGYDDLAGANPSLVYASITPFGSDGPKADYAWSDITLCAAAGPMSFTGDSDRAPLRMGLPQAMLHAGGDAADAILIALRERKRSGVGQHIDVSAQQSYAQATQSFILATPLNETPTVRVTGGAALAGLTLPLIWTVLDGYVSLTFFFGSAIGPFSRRLMEWIHEEGGCDEATRDKDWIGYAQLLLTGEESREEYARVLDIIGDFLRTKTKAELLEQAMKRRLLIIPVSSIEDLHDSPQFASRRYWRDSSEGAVSGRYPGPFAAFGETPVEAGRSAPTVGEHDEELPQLLTRRPAVERLDGEDDGQALSDIKVLDLMWVMAGPAATRVLADYGATVVKIESTTRVDTARGLQPFLNGQPGPENSGLYSNMNTGKLGMTLDISSEVGREVILDLVRWADVVTESFSPRAMRNWGLDYAALREVNPKIIMLSSSLFGQSGPHSEIAGFGTMGAAAAGFNSIVGWPDRDPAMAAAYSDYVAPRFTVAALLAALEHRDRTGEGQYIDFSQAEACIHFLSPAILDFSVNGRGFQRIGNADPQIAPHGVYRAAGDDRWVAIATPEEEQWQALAGIIGRGDLAGSLTDLTLRQGRLADIDAAITLWTSGRDMFEAERELQAAGVPAHAVQNSPECSVDPQLLHRGHFVELEHDVVGPVVVEGSRFRLSRTPAQVTRSAPSFGRDNFEVLTEILGYDADRVAELAAAEVLQ